MPLDLKAQYRKGKEKDESSVVEFILTLRENMEVCWT